MFIRNLVGRDTNRVGSTSETAKQRARKSRRDAFRSDMARRLRVESLEQRMMLASDIGISGGDTILLTDTAGGSVNNIEVDYDTGTNELIISDATGLTGDADLDPFITGDTLTLPAADMEDFGISDIEIDTGDEADSILILGTPDDNEVSTFTGVTTVSAGAGDDVIELGSGGSMDGILADVEVDGGDGSDELSLIDFAGTADPVVRIRANEVIGIAPGDVGYANIQQLTVDVVDSGTAEILVESTSAETEVPLDSGAQETITFGANGDMSGILGEVLLNDFFGGGNDTIIYDDAAYAGGRSYTLAEDGSLQATDVADITVAGGTFEHVELLTGSGDDTVDMTADDIPDFVIETNGGNDTVTITTLDDATAGIEVDTGAGEDSIELIGGEDASSNVALEGGADNDEITLTASASDTMTVDAEGGLGNDTFLVTVEGGATTGIDLAGGTGSDTLVIDLTDTTDPLLEVIPTLLGGEAEFTFDAAVPLTFREIESVEITGTVTELLVSEDESPDFANDDTDDQITLSRVDSQLDLNVNDVPQIRVTLAALDLVTVEGSDDSETLIIDNGGGLVNAEIDFNGNGQTGTPGDTLVVEGDPGTDIARETYIVGATQDAGTVVLDPDDSAGPGLGGAFNGDEQVITFTGLEPIDTSTPAALFDVILTANADDVRIEDGGSLNGFDSIRVVDLNGTFETFRFANKTAVRLNGVLEDDTFRVEYTTAAAGLSTMELYGHLAPSIPGPADDDSYEFVTLHSTDAVTTNIFTQGGSDRIEERSFILDGLQGTINVIGGETLADNDYFSLQDINDAGPDTVTITDSSITGAAPATFNYDEIEKLLFEGTAGDDTIDVLSTSAEAETFVTGNGGSDTVTVGNQTADFDTTFDGSLDGIAGPLAVSGEFNGAAGDDTLNVDDSGTGGLHGAATIDNDTYTFDLTGVGTSFDGPVTELGNFAPATIRYFYDTIAPFGMDPRLEFLNVLGSTGDDDITVEVTTAVDTTTVDGFEGSDLMTVNGDGLSADNVFAGGDQADDFVLDVTANLGDTSFVDLTGLEFAGNDPAATTAQRDRLTINDESGVARDLLMDYLDSAGDLDILPGTGGGLGAGAEDIPVNVRTMESVLYEGTGTDDTVAIEGTTADDDLTVAPLADNTAMVFLGGNPWDGPSDAASFTDALPGVGGGSSGPDLLLTGLDDGPGLEVNDADGTNQLYIYGLTEGGLSDGSAVDHFGFGAGLILPEPGNMPFPDAADAYDRITVTDTQTLVNSYIPVRYNTTDFAQADPALDRAIFINAGFEGNPPATPGTDVADDITLIPSVNYLFQINGGDPDPATTGIVPLDGDRLNVISPTNEIDIYSDKSTPTNVSVSFGGGVLPFEFSSIENLQLDANDGTVNLIGDNNNTTAQHDNFVVVGRDVDADPSDGGYQEVELFINGSNPIRINNVQFLNAMGHQETDTLDVTPYADNTPRGWGIDVRFDEGPPAQDDGEQVDLLIYNTSLFHDEVSEDIVVQPSGVEHGELRVINGAFGTPIVTIGYVNNLDIIVNDNDGGLSDTDTITMLGTNPDNTGTSGDELVAADFSAAGDLDNPLVTVWDAEDSDMIYRVRDLVGFDTVNLDMLGGEDAVSVIGRADGSLTPNVHSAESLTITGAEDAADQFMVYPGTVVDSGHVAAGSTTVHFDGTDTLTLDGAGGTGTDVFGIQGTAGSDELAVSAGESPAVDTSFGPRVVIAAPGSDDSQLALHGNGGDDKFAVEALADLAIDLAGGDPTASDEVVVEGTAGDDTLLYEPTGTDAATVTVNSLLPIDLSTVELVTLDGIAGTDELTVATAAGDNQVTLTPADKTDGGDVQVDNLLPMKFARLGAGGSVVLSDAATDDADTFVYNGTPATEAFTVGLATVFLDSRLPVSTTGVESYELQGRGGDDVFSVQAQLGIDVTVEGDGPSGSDTLNYAADAGEVDPVVIVELDSVLTDDPFQQTIEQDGYGIVAHSGVETVNMDVEEGELYVAGTRADDVITVTPLSGDSALLEAEHIPTKYNIDDVPADESLVITGGGTGRGGPDGGGFADKVVVMGTNGRDLLRVDGPNREIGLDVLGFSSTSTWRSVTLDDGTAEFGTAGVIEVVEVAGRDGNDTVYVAPAAPVGDGLFVEVNGGSPRASDALVVAELDESGDPVALGDNVFVALAASRVADAGNVLVFQDAERLPGIAYENVEVVSPRVDSGDNLLILGPDEYEPNEFPQTSAFLGSGEEINVENLSIFPNAGEHPGVPADQDYFQVVADTTGILDFQVYFNAFDEGLLPAGGNLDVEVLDAAGNVVAGDGDFGTHDDTADTRVRIPAVAGQSYFLHVYGATEEVINGYDLTVTNEAPPKPYDLELLDIPVDPDYDPTVDPPAENSDTGRSNDDNVTADNSPTVIVRLDDGIFLHDLPGNPDDGSPADEVIPIPFNESVEPDSTEAGYRVAVYVEGDPQQPGVGPQTVIGYAQPGDEEGVYLFDFDDAIVEDAVDLLDGTHFISARVEMIDPADPTQLGYGGRSDSLEVFIDTEAPNLESVEIVDEGDCAFAPDLVGTDLTPTFRGTAEANAIVRFYIDINGDGELQVDEDYELGLTVAEPLDGDEQFPEGYFEFESPIGLNDEVLLDLGLDPDDPRIIFVTAEDLAGNRTSEEEADFQLFIDAQGPQITEVFVTDDPGYDLFNPKPSEDGPSPLVDSITIEVQDFPERVADDLLYPALVEEIAEHPGHYRVVGDANGIIPIDEVIVTAPTPSDGEPAMASIELVFAEPLPDDRFTLTVSDALIDPACNNLDGESNATEPQEDPIPEEGGATGDGVPGGDFVARFTVDTRPEVGVWAAGNIWVDTNGNYIFDPTNEDFTNRDIVYQMGYTSDDVFAGNFARGVEDVADGFDKLAVYGRVGADWRWLVDTDNDGVAEVEQVDPLGINGLPVAGEFDGSTANGDEVGVFTGSQWYFDTNHDFQLDSASSLNSSLTGYPIVGDFDGDGFDDLGSWADDRFQIDLANGSLRGWDGSPDEIFRFGYIGVRARPVAADMNMDGYDDLGLWLPDRSGVLPRNSGEWQFLVSEDPDTPGRSMSVLSRIDVDPITGEDRVAFTPVPFGPDISAQFGDDYALPVVGNFDPPVAGGSGGADGDHPYTNVEEPSDVNADGFVSPIDALLVIRELNRDGGGSLQGTSYDSLYVDVNMDGFLSPIDALTVIKTLNERRGGEGEAGAEGEASGSFEVNSSNDLISETAPPTGEAALDSALLNSPLIPAVGGEQRGTSTASTTNSALTPSETTAEDNSEADATINFNLLGDEELAELAEAMGAEGLFETLPESEALDELAGLVEAEDTVVVDELFRRWGEN